MAARIWGLREIHGSRGRAVSSEKRDINVQSLFNHDQPNRDHPITALFRAINRYVGNLPLRTDHGEAARLALRTKESKCCRITGFPIVPPSVQRLKPPPLPGPVGSHGTVAVVDFLHQLLHWFPAEAKCNLRSNVKIDFLKQKCILGD